VIGFFVVDCSSIGQKRSQTWGRGLTGAAGRRLGGGAVLCAVVGAVLLEPRFATGAVLLEPRFATAAGAWRGLPRVALTVVALPPPPPPPPPPPLWLAGRCGRCLGGFRGSCGAVAEETVAAVLPVEGRRGGGADCPLRALLLALSPCWGSGATLPALGPLTSTRLREGRAEADRPTARRACHQPLVSGVSMQRAAVALMRSQSRWAAAHRRSEEAATAPPP
jgi:hypothetical protein